jgi:TPR repeat protein
MGNADGMTSLGFMYREGLGVPGDGGEAMRWFLKAVDKGHAQAMTTVGHMYAEGTAVRQDDAEAARWFRRASDKGDALASFNLAMSYGGGLGVARDGEAAARLLLLAMRQEGSSGVVDSLRQMGGPVHLFVLGVDGCRAIQRRLREAGVYTAAEDDDCVEAEALSDALDRFRAGPPA